MKILRTIIIIIAATIVAMMVAVVLIALDAKDDAVFSMFIIVALSLCGVFGLFSEPTTKRKLHAQINEDNADEKRAA